MELQTGFLKVPSLVAAFLLVAACGYSPIGIEAPAATGEPHPADTPLHRSTQVPSIPEFPSPPPAMTTDQASNSASTAAETATPSVSTSTQPMGSEPQLQMVLIRASANELQQLRKMPVNIIRVRPIEGGQTPTSKTDFLQSEYLVEAVVPVGLLARLEQSGIEITEVP